MHPSAPRPTIPLVERIINDTQCEEYQALRAFDPGNPYGDIVLIDEPERCLYFSERFVTCDERDNADGKPTQDYLPDFAGERIVSLVDPVYSPYSRFVLADNANALREVTVRAVVGALDTTCCLGPFDHEKRSRKPAAKLLVLASPYMAAYGGFDVDTLFRSTGIAVPVLSGPEVMMEQAMGEKGGTVSIAFLTDSLTAAAGVYPVVFNELCRKRGDSYSTLYVYSMPQEALSDSLSLSAAEMQADPFKQILDRHSASGRTTALSALVVDDRSVCVDSLQASYSRILSHPSEENAFYRKMLSKDFRFIDGAKALTDACYRYLREHNLFTHIIAYPVAAAYQTSPEAKGYMLMDFDVNTLPVELSDRLRATAPETFKMYVPDQYHARGN